MFKFGFYDFDDAEVGSDGVIYKETLTALPSSGATEVGSPTYSSAGMTGTATAGLKLSSISGQSALATEGTLRVMVDTTSLDHGDAPAAGVNLIVFKVGTTLNFQKQTGTYFRMVCSSPLDGKDTAVDSWIYFDPAGYETNEHGQVELVITWDMGGLQVFADRLRIVDLAWLDSATRPTASEIYLNSAGSSGGTGTFRDVLIADKKMVIRPSTPQARVIHWYGDSYTSQGNYPDTDTGSRQSMWVRSPSSVAGTEAYTEDGQNGTAYDGVNAGDSSSAEDSGMIPNCQRWLAKNGVFVHRIRWWGEGGSGMEATGAGLGQTIPLRVDTAVSGNYDLPDVAVFVFGYNDGSQNGGDGPADLGAYQTTITDTFAAIRAVNANCSIIICTLPYNTNASYDPTLASAQGINTAITAAAAATSNCTLIDINTLTGGYTLDGSDWFKGDYIHPNIAGQALYGQKIAEAIVAAIR